MKILIMSLLKLLFIFTPGFLFNIYSSTTNPVYISGKLIKSSSEDAGYVAHVIVFVKGANKVLARTITDDKGKFELSFTPADEKSFDFYCTSVGIDTILLASVTSFESDTPTMTFLLPAKPIKNKFGKVICPLCRKSNKVYTIIYGDNPLVRIQINERGDTTYSPIVNGKYYSGSCAGGPAGYYCDRDKIKF